MGEEIDINRSVRLLAEDAHLLAYLIGGPHGAGQGPQATGLGDGDGNPGVGRARHGSLDYGVFQANQVENASIGPHGCASLT